MILRIYIIRDCHLVIIPCAPFKILGSNVNKYDGFKSSYFKKLRMWESLWDGFIK